MRRDKYTIKPNRRIERSTWPTSPWPLPYRINGSASIPVIPIGSANSEIKIFVLHRGFRVLTHFPRSLNKTLNHFLTGALVEALLPLKNDHTPASNIARLEELRISHIPRPIPRRNTLLFTPSPVLESGRI